MNPNAMARNILFSVSFVGLLSWIYAQEIVPFWGYMGFGGVVTPAHAIVVILLSAILGMLLPTQLSTRSLLLTILHYAFLLPSALMVVVDSSGFTHVAAFLIVVLCLYVFSALPLRAIILPSISRKQLLGLIVGAIVVALSLQVAFGGLTYFSLDIASVYEFRRVAAADLPGFFGYIFSNVAKVLIPVGVLIAIMYRSTALAAFVVLSAVLLFGMSHHKSILFTPFVVVILFFAFRRFRDPSMIGTVFVALLLISVLEGLLQILLSAGNSPGWFTSLTVRRALLIPPMLDREYIELFLDHPKYYWSTSRFGLGIAERPADVTAPFLLGDYAFGREDMSANSGIIGSGFANAGLFGVTLYSTILGCLISMLNAFGRRCGHAFVAASSIILVVTIASTTDLTTVVLSHGLLLLLLLLMVVPRGTEDTSQKYQKTMSLVT